MQVGDPQTRAAPLGVHPPPESMVAQPGSLHTLLVADVKVGTTQTRSLGAVRQP